jgi:cation:H+ antiporter
MELAVTIILFVIGLLCIIKGGDWFVDSAAWIAEVSGIPKFIVGSTIVSVATTLPELITSIIATAQGKVDLGVGNAVGSVTANTGLILGVSLVFMAGVVSRKQFAPKAVLLILSCAALYLIVRLQEGVSAAGGLILLAIFLCYLGENIYSARRTMGLNSRIPFERKELPRRLLFFVLGTVGIVVGADLLVDNGSALALVLGVPESVVALTLVAIGTSLPELVTAITAIVKRQGLLSVGNIIGANIIDLTLILPVCAIVSGGKLTVSPQTWQLDLPVCLGMTLAAMVIPLVTRSFYRWQGALMVAGYLGYLAVLVLL